MGLFDNVSWNNPLPGRQPIDWNPLNAGGTFNLGGNPVNINPLKEISKQLEPQNEKMINKTPPTLTSQTPNPVAPSPVAPNPSALVNRAPTNNTGGEDAFRNTYLNSLKPNTAFTFNAQNPSTFGSSGKSAGGSIFSPTGGK